MTSAQVRSTATDNERLAGFEEEDELDGIIIEPKDPFVEAFEDYAAKTFGNKKPWWRYSDPLFRYGPIDAIVNVVLLVAIFALRFGCTNTYTVESAADASNVSNSTVLSIASNDTITATRVCRTDNLELWYIALFVFCAYNVYHILCCAVNFIVYLFDDNSSLKHRRDSVGPIAFIATAVTVFVVYFTVVDEQLNENRRWGDKSVAVVLVLALAWLAAYILSVVLFHYVSKRHFKDEQVLLAKEDLFSRFVQSTQRTLLKRKSFTFTTRNELLELDTEKALEYLKAQYLKFAGKSGILKKKHVSRQFRDPVKGKYAWEILTLGDDTVKDVSSLRFSLVLMEIWKARNKLIKQKKNAESLKVILRNVLYCIIAIIASLIAAAVLLDGIIDLTATLVSMVTFSLSFAFVFGNILKEIAEGIIFILIDNRVSVGDRMIVGTETIIVSRITIRHTIGYTPNGRRITWPNSKLSQMAIENRTRTKTMSLDIVVPLGFSAPTKDILKLKEGIEKYIQKNCLIFEPKLLFYISESSLEGIYVKFWVTLHGVNWGEPRLYLLPQTDIFLHIKELVRKLKLPMKSYGITILNKEGVSK